MKQQLIDAGVDFPKCMPVDLCVDALLNLHGPELLDFFRVKDLAALSRKLNPYLPNRPARTPLYDYIKSIVDTPTAEDLLPEIDRPLPAPKFAEPTITYILYNKLVQEDKWRREECKEYNRTYVPDPRLKHIVLPKEAAKEERG